MKIRLLVISALLLFIISVPVFSQKVYYEWQKTNVICNETKSEIKVSINDLKDTPSWTPEKDESAPLSLQKAIEIGRKTLKECTTDDNWIVWEIKLTHLATDKWFYEINFRNDSTDDVYFKKGSFVVYVKMDGTAVKPEPLRPENNKQNPE